MKERKEINTLHETIDRLDKANRKLRTELEKFHPMTMVRSENGGYWPAPEKADLTGKKVKTFYVKDLH